jgi:segregation and condensation protein A
VRTVRIEQFEGPLDLLLELIENTKLDISDVSLAAVTEQYLTTLASANGLPTEELADFLVVAARLLLLKSKTLLPGMFGGDAEEGAGLAAQLTLYRTYVEASRRLRGQLRNGHPLFIREHPLVSGPTFLPPKTISGELLAGSFRAFLAHVEPPLRTSPDLVRRTVSLHERIRHIQGLLAARERFGFSDLFVGSTNRTEIVVTFLALLELVKQRTVALSQDSPFSEITVQAPSQAQPHA